MMKPDMSPPTHDGSKFTWRNGHGSCELSDFMPSHFSGRVWSDAADVGFYIRSHKTGASKLFLFREEHKDGEGDVTHWVFAEHGGPTVVTIFND